MTFQKRSHPAPTVSGWSELGSVIAVNARLLLAALFVVVARQLWPDSPEWYGFGLISICLVGASVALAIDGFREMLRGLARKRTVESQTKDAVETKLSRPVSTDVLRDAGMKR
ncbi:MAG: hypothetical protein QNJ16_13075 [Rhodobacter sp.]|nr:hypothetical protein [Rhodobacter sp.]